MLNALIRNSVKLLVPVGVFSAAAAAYQHQARKEQDVVKVPDHLTKEQAFAALYSAANESHHRALASSWGISDEKFLENGRLESPEDAAEVFKAYCATENCGLVLNQFMGVSFSNFPELNRIAYDKHHGDGAMKRALHDPNLQENLYPKASDHTGNKSTLRKYGLRAAQ